MFDPSNISDPIKINGEIDWEKLSKNIGEQKSYEWMNYAIEQHYCGLTETYFILFTKITQGPQLVSRDPDRGIKIHVGLNYENVQAALNPILHVLVNHSVSPFKLVLSTCYEKLLKEGQFGKTFTIYLADKQSQEQKQIAHEIEAAVKQLNLPLPEKRATDCSDRKDQGIPGCQFVTGAFPRGNAFVLSSLFDKRDDSPASDGGNQCFLSHRL